MYTEDDQFGIKPLTKEDIEKSKKQKKLIIIIAVFVLISFILIIVGILVFNYFYNKTDATFPVTVLSTTEWTNQPVTLSIENQEIKLVSYSFDGGKTWQKENAIQVTENGSYVVVVKNEKGKVSEKATVTISNIDMEGPIIKLTDPLYVQKGGVYNSKSGISVTDDGSGVREYVSEPSIIDTSSDGEYVVTYTASDYVGNTTSLSRKVIVRNLITTTYYRSRSVKVERYRCKKEGCNSESSSCYTTCKRNVYGEWSPWTTEEIRPNSKIEIETKIE